MKNLNLLLLITIMCFLSCDMGTVIDIEIPAHEPVLVLNGRLDTDTNIQVLISSSVGAFDNSTPSMVNDANVILFENNIEIETLTLDTNTYELEINDGNWNNATYVDMNYYVSNYTPIKNKTYRIEVKHPNYNSINGSTYVPDDIVIYNVNIDSTSSSDKINFQFSFNDNMNQDNFYSLKLRSVCNKIDEDDFGYEYSYGYYENKIEMLSNDPSFPAGIDDLLSGYTFSGRKVIFNDALFNGQQKRISVDVFKDDIKYANCDSVKFVFSTFSDDSYKYYNSLSEQRDNGGLDIFGGEVVPVYTNITNGLGILISKNAQEFYIKF